jgi:hypothetical protein
MEESIVFMKKKEYNIINKPSIKQDDSRMSSLAKRGRYMSFNANTQD